MALLTRLALLFWVFQDHPDLGHPPVLRDRLGPADPIGPALLGVLARFRTTALTLATPLCYGTTLALLTRLALLFWVFRTTLTLATPLCYGTTLALLTRLALPGLALFLPSV